ncbi:hypothetical protein SDC9_150316 [bioreactor metagenome]|uniref:Uncharacterized protein n=1 Tax=bioreactor metagenome TaxID=1076179 RepID=A0A645ERD8_9ZZZZ
MVVNPFEDFRADDSGARGSEAVLRRHAVENLASETAAEEMDAIGFSGKERDESRGSHAAEASGFFSEKDFCPAFGGREARGSSCRTSPGDKDIATGDYWNLA